MLGVGVLFSMVMHALYQIQNASLLGVPFPLIYHQTTVTYSKAGKLVFVPIVKLKLKEDKAGNALAPVRLVKLPVNVAGPKIAFAGRNKVTFFRSVELSAVLFLLVIFTL